MKKEQNKYANKEVCQHTNMMKFKRLIEIELHSSSVYNDTGKIIVKSSIAQQNRLILTLCINKHLANHINIGLHNICRELTFQMNQCQVSILFSL